VSEAEPLLAQILTAFLMPAPSSLPFYCVRDPRRGPAFPSGAALLALALSMVLGGCIQQPLYEAVAQADAAATVAQRDTLNQDITLLAAQAAVAPGEYTVGPEDLVEITLYDIEDTSGEPRVIVSRVSNAGYVTLPYVGKVRAAGFSPIALEDELRSAYLEFIRDPQITVFVSEYRSYRVSIVGFVENPGVLELRGRKTLLEALALAGGLNEEAGRSIRLTRSGEGSVQSVLVDLEQLTSEGDVRLNLDLLPGDVINVPRAGIFYVEGMVKKPGAYPLLGETTVSQALATAGGVDVAVARVGGTTLYRKNESGQRLPIPVELSAILEGRKPDFNVLPDDVIVVPLSGPKFFVDRLTGLLRVGVNSSL
jgi:polysaccharide export outer membrane protein